MSTGAVLELDFWCTEMDLSLPPRAQSSEHQWAYDERVSRIRLVRATVGTRYLSNAMYACLGS